MTSSDPIVVSIENRLERASLRAIEAKLDPWIVSWLDGRDDHGRDGFVQLVDQSVTGARLTPGFCALQAKSTASALPPHAAVRVETRHLALWTEADAPPTLFALWSRRDDEMRVRPARAFLQEVDRTSPGWRAQETVTLHLDQNHRFPTNWSHEDLGREVADELDRRGGRSAFHKAKRRVLLTCLFPQRTTTAVRLNLTERGAIHIGGGWAAEEVGPADRGAESSIAAAFLVYEQVWVPMSLAGALAELVGGAALEDLVARGRVVFLVPTTTVGFLCEPDKRTGALLTFQRHDDDPSKDEVAAWTALIERQRRIWSGRSKTDPLRRSKTDPPS